MKEKKFKIIKGGLGARITQSKKRFVSAFVTDTRLMGVLVLYIHWTVCQDEIDTEFHQFFYIDAEEYGIEIYRGIPGDDADALYELEQSMLGGLGGSRVDLNEREATALVQKYAAVTREHHFQLPPDHEEFDFLLQAEQSFSPEEEDSLFAKTCILLDTPEQVINYFLMRYFSMDREAVRFLSARPVSLTAAPNKHSETLCKNSIEPYDNHGRTSFLCESLIENENRYQLVMSEIFLQDLKVETFYIRSSFFVSNSEAAMMLGRPEFITVYEIMGDIGDVRKKLSALYPGILQKPQEGGHLYLQFKSNNDHLKEAVYRLNDDIRNIFYITEFGQLIVAAYSLRTIHTVERELQAVIGNMIIPSAKYEFKESVFYEFVQGDFTDFTDFMDYLNEFDPE